MTPPNIFDNLEQLSGVLGIEDLLEGRFENDGNDNPIYVGYSPFVNADPSEAVWFIRQIIYEGTAIVRTRLPDDGIGFIYVWDDRASYFTA